MRSAAAKASAVAWDGVNGAVCAPSQAPSPQEARIRLSPSVPLLPPSIATGSFESSDNNRPPSSHPSIASLLVAVARKLSFVFGFYLRGESALKAPAEG